jgi:hypothetical protein
MNREREKAIDIGTIASPREFTGGCRLARRFCRRKPDSWRMRRRDVGYAVVELLVLSMDTRVITAAAEAGQCSAGAEFAQGLRKFDLFLPDSGHRLPRSLFGRRANA